MLLTIECLWVQDCWSNKTTHLKMSLGIWDMAIMICCFPSCCHTRFNINLFGHFVLTLANIMSIWYSLIWGEDVRENWTYWQGSGRFQWGRSVRPSAKWRAGRRRAGEKCSWRWWTRSWEPGLPESILQEGGKRGRVLSIIDTQSSLSKASIYLH